MITEHRHLAEDLARWSGERAAAYQREVCELDGCPHDCADRARADAERDRHEHVLHLPLAQVRAWHARELASRTATP